MNSSVPYQALPRLGALRLRLLPLPDVDHVLLLVDERLRADQGLLNAVEVLVQGRRLGAEVALLGKEKRETRLVPVALPLSVANVSSFGRADVFTS